VRGAWAGWRGRSGVFSLVCKDKILKSTAAVLRPFSPTRTTLSTWASLVILVFQKFAGAGHRWCPSGHEDAVLDCPHSWSRRQDATEWIGLWATSFYTVRSIKINCWRRHVPDLTLPNPSPTRGPRKTREQDLFFGVVGIRGQLT
jgi:hypothetical protein